MNGRASATVRSVGEPLEILVVDDLPHKRLAFEALLSPLGQRLTRVDSGTEALRHVLAKKFDILILDVNIPDMDGLEVARLIREHKRYRDTPILFVSALDDPEGSLSAEIIAESVWLAQYLPSSAPSTAATPEQWTIG